MAARTFGVGGWLCRYFRFSEKQPLIRRRLRFWRPLSTLHGASSKNPGILLLLMTRLPRHVKCLPSASLIGHGRASETRSDLWMTHSFIWHAQNSPRAGCPNLALSGQFNRPCVCPLLDHSGQTWILACGGLSAFDPVQTFH